MRWIHAASALFVSAALLCGGCSKRPSPVEDGGRTQTLHLGNGAEPRDLDPQVAIAYSDYNVLMALFEGLTVLDEATSRPLPGMAETWDISPDGRVYTFHLRPATWSNGDPVQAADFAFALERLLTPRLASEYAQLGYAVQGAEAFNQGREKDFSTVGVEVVNSRTLRLTLARPTPYFLSLVAHQAWFPVHRPTVAAAGDPFQRNTGWTRPGRFVGNGAFVLEEWVPDQRIVVRKNPSYWGAEQNRLSRVVFHPIASPQVEESNYRTGQLHLTFDVMPARIDHYRAERPTEIRVDPALETVFLRFNVTQPPLQDRRVRQALARAIDREAIAQSVLRGSKLPAFNLVPPKTGGYSPATRVPHDPETARRLLAEAGYPDGRGFPKIELQMNSDPVNLAIHEAIQQMWRKELNIEVALIQLEYRVYVDNQDNLAFQVNRSRWVGDYDDPSTFLDLFTSNNPNNNTGWKSAEYDRWIDEASREREPARRAELLQKAESVLLDDAPIAPVYFGTRTFLIKPQVKGWVPSPLGIHRYQTVWLE